MTLRTVRCLAASLACCLTGLASAQGTEYLIIGGGAQQMAGADGANLAAHWVATMPAGTLSVGAARTDLGDSRWTLVSVGAFRTFPRGWSLSSGLDVGPAILEGASERITKLRAEAAFPVSSRWTLRVEETYVDVRPVSGHLLSGAVRFAASQALSFDVKAGRSIVGNLDDESLSLRLDYRAAPPYLLAGIVLGSSNNRLLLNIPGPGTTTRLRQGFVGLTFPIDAASVTIAVEVAKIGDTRRSALSASLRLPVDWMR